MKKNRFAIILLIVLVIIAAVVIISKSSQSTLDDKYSHFAVEDTATISKIFLADKNNNTVLLTRDTSGIWMVNKNYKASRNAMDIIMKTVCNLEIKSPIAKQSHNNFIKSIASRSVKIEIYQQVYRISLFNKIKLFKHEKCTRTYYVGFDTQDNTGTVMLMEGSEVPYIVDIPGFRGFLSTRYSAYEKDWRDHTVFSIKYADLKSITMRFPYDPENSFKAEKKNQRDFIITSLADNKQVLDYDTIKILDLFAAFVNLRHELFINDLPKKDSIIKSTPFQILTLEDYKGQTYSIKTFHKRSVDNSDVDPYYNFSPYDRDRFYALTNNDKDFVLLQFFVFDNVIRPLAFYRKGFIPPDYNKIYSSKTKK
jgi:hypothetical protein